MATSVVIKDLTVRYGQLVAVDNVTLSIEPRAVTAFIGPSGCGKSTVLRAVNRMHDLTPSAHVAGRVLLDGEDIYDDTVDPVAVRRVVGMVFQRPNPFPTMSVYDNVAAGLRLNRRMSKGALDEVVERSLRAANLWDEVKDRLRRHGGSLSGGQQQRLCIARAIAVEPQVILMDEPASALDPVSTQAIEELVTQLSDEYTIVIVTHNMQQAARVSQTTAFFNVEHPGAPGMLVEAGDTEQIFHAPMNKATAAYVAGRFG